MNISEREKRLLILAAVVIPLILIYVAMTPSDPKVVAPVISKESIPMAEQRLTRIRQSVARVPAREVLLKQANAELADREKTLIDADTAAQATEQLLQVVRTVARAQGPAVEIRSVEMGMPASFGDAYGEVSVSISTECRMEQLVNFMADLSARKEAIGTRELRLAAANGKEKTVGVRLTIAALVPRKLVPKRKEAF